MRRTALLVAAVALLAAPRPCLGEPVVITSGSAGLYWDGQLTSFAFTGPSTSIVQDGRNVWGPTGFTVGSPVQFSGTLSPESSHGFQMTVNGTTYDNAVLVGSASFVTSTYTALVGDPAARDVELPLMLVGHFDGFTFGDPGGTPLFSFDVAQQGLFRSTFVNVFGDTFLNSSFVATAEFTGPSTPSQTPEPASLLLMATPLGALGLRRIQKRFGL